MRNYLPFGGELGGLGSLETRVLSFESAEPTETSFSGVEF